MKQEYYRLPKLKRLLNLSGVPISCLNRKVDPNKFNYDKVSIKLDDNKVIIIDGARQKSLFTDVVSSIADLGNSGFYAVGSFPTEQPGYDMVTTISTLYFEKKFENKEMPNIKWIDLGVPDYSYFKSDDEPQIVVIHNLNEDSDPKRLTLAKDFFHRSDSATKILLVTTPNILNFCFSKFNIKPDAVWQLGKTVHRVVV